jgi:ankyrin repeat protein
MTKGILHVKPEVPLTTIEKGKRIVGGCGMSLTPMKVSPSLKGEIILQEYGSLVQQLEPEKLTSIGTESGSGLQGAIFKLMFEDLPPEMKEDYTWMENLFFASNQEMIQMSLAMQQLSEAITQNDVPTFNKFMQDSSAHLSQMRDRHGATLLHVAAMQKNPYYIQELVKKGLSTTIPDKKRYLPIHYAAMYGNKDVITFLLSANPSTINAESHDKSTPLVVAIQNGQEVIVKFLLHQKAAYDTITSAGYTPLHCALHHGHEAIAKALLEQPGIDVNRQTEEGVTPLMLACEIDSEKLVEVLLHKGARPDVERKDGITALDIAVKRNCFTVCKVLSRIAKLSNFTIELAVKESSMDILQLLSSKPNFLTYRNYAKDTPLILAIRWGHIPAALHIIDVMTQVADFNAENVFGESPISLSAACGFTQLIEAMINKRAVVRPKELLKKLCRLDISPFLTHYISTVQLSADDLQELLLVAAEAGQPIIIRNLLLPRQVNLDALQSPKKWKIRWYLSFQTESFEK